MNQLFKNKFYQTLNPLGMIPWRVVKIGARFWCKLRNANIPPKAKKPTMPHPVTPNQNHHSQTHAQTQSKHPSPRNLNLKPPQTHKQAHN